GRGLRWRCAKLCTSCARVMAAAWTTCSEFAEGARSFGLRAQRWTTVSRTTRPHCARARVRRAPVRRTAGLLAHRARRGAVRRGAARDARVARLRHPRVERRALLRETAACVLGECG